MAEPLPPELSGSRVSLSATQIETVGRYGSEIDAAAGEVLFADGDDAYDLIVLIEGSADIVEGLGAAKPRVINSYGPRDFLGEVGLLTGQRAFLSAVMTGDGRVIRVPSQAVHQTWLRSRTSAR
jgi:thioredoxin reductase (NADPH)